MGGEFQASPGGLQSGQTRLPFSPDTSTGHSSLVTISAIVLCWLVYLPGHLGPPQCLPYPQGVAADFQPVPSSLEPKVRRGELEGAGLRWELQVSSSPNNQMQKGRKKPPGQGMSQCQWAGLVTWMAAPGFWHIREGAVPSPTCCPQRGCQGERGPSAPAGPGLPDRRHRQAPASFPAAAHPSSTAHSGSLWDFSIKSSGSDLLQRCLAILISSRVAMGRRVMSLTQKTH